MARTRHSIAYVMLDCHEEILDHHNRIADIVAEEGDIAYLLHDAEPKLTAAAEYYKMDIEERLDAEEEDAEEDTGDEGKKPGTSCLICLVPTQADQQGLRILCRRSSTMFTTSRGSCPREFVVNALCRLTLQVPNFGTSRILTNKVSDLSDCSSSFRTST